MGEAGRKGQGVGWFFGGFVKINAKGSLLGVPALGFVEYLGGGDDACCGDLKNCYPEMVGRKRY